MKTVTFGSGWATYTVTVEPKKFITVQRDNETPVTFAVGDTCEESSYNLVYLGTIVGITEKSVIVKPRFGDRNRRMKIENFAWRNWNFDIDRITQENFETSQYI